MAILKVEEYLQELANNISTKNSPKKPEDIIRYIRIRNKDTTAYEYDVLFTIIKTGKKELQYRFNYIEPKNADGVKLPFNTFSAEKVDSIVISRIFRDGLYSFDRELSKREMSEFISNKEKQDEYITATFERRKDWEVIQDPWDPSVTPPFNLPAAAEVVPEVKAPDPPVAQQAPSAPIPTPKIKLNILGLSDDIKVTAKQDIPDFKIYVGEIPIEDDLIRSNDYDSFDDSEYVEDDYGAYEEEKLVFDGDVIIAFSDSELARDNTVSEASASEAAGAGVNTGSGNVVAPGAAVPVDKVVLGAFADVRNASIVAKQSVGNDKIDIADFITPSGEKISKSEIIKNINEFVADVLAPFAMFLKAGYPDLYKNWIVTSATRAYIPKGGSSTSQHFRGQAIDSQITNSGAQNPDGNIRLLNAMLAWYEKNPVGYGQILFETRGKSCWVHWSYKRGNTRLMLARFKDDSTLNAPANTVGKYVLPPLTSNSLGFA